jgi:hypothetical protein
MSEKRRPRNGKPVSMPAELRSENRQVLSQCQLERLLTAAYTLYQRLEDPAADVKSRQSFVFHMTDWREDLERLATLYRDPGQFDREAAGAIVFEFLIHALPHLLAAGRLLLGEVRDPFAELENKT